MIHDYFAAERDDDVEQSPLTAEQQRAETERRRVARQQMQAELDAAGTS